MSDLNVGRTFICTGCHYRALRWSGVFDPKMAMRVQRQFMADPLCEIHGDPEIVAAYKSFDR